MPILELTQREFKKLKKAQVIPLSGSSDEPQVYLDVTAKELKLVKQSGVLDFPASPASASQLPSSPEVRPSVTKDELRNYQKIKLKQNRDRRKKRKQSSERRAVYCPECGLVVLNYEKMLEHQQEHS